MVIMAVDRGNKYVAAQETGRNTSIHIITVNALTYILYRITSLLQHYLVNDNFIFNTRPRNGHNVHKSGPGQKQSICQAALISPHTGFHYVCHLRVDSVIVLSQNLSTDVQRVRDLTYLDKFCSSK